MPYRLIDPSTSPRMRKVLHTIGGAATGLLIVGVLFLLVQTSSLSTAIRVTQLDNAERNETTKEAAEQAKLAAEQAARTAFRIEDCTTPGGQCFEQSQKRTGQAVAGINQGTLAVIVAALSCQDDGIVGQKALARCTAERAARSDRR